MAEQWKSPRKIEEEIKEYRAKRFEDYMQMADRGEVTRAIAITALREEIANTVDLGQPIELEGSI